MLVSEHVEGLNKRWAESGFPSAPFAFGADPPIPGLPETPTSPDTKTDWLESWLDWLQRGLHGGIVEEPDEFQKRLVNFPKPSYPAIAQRAGLQRIVKLQVRGKRDRSVEVQKLLGGDTALAHAALAAVKQCRATDAS